MWAIGALLAGALLAWAGAAAAQPVISQAPPPDVAGVRVVRVAEGLDQAWGLGFLPDGTLIVTERPGRLRLVRNGTLDPRPVENLPELRAAGRYRHFGGLMDVAVHPDFATNRTIFLSYAHGEDEANRTRIARAVLDGHALRDIRVIFEADRTKRGYGGFGGRILILPDRTLLFTLGDSDGQDPPGQVDGRFVREAAQDPGTHWGKVVRINEDGSVPPDNPFIGRPGVRPEIWSLGHRNSQGIAWDPIRRLVWSNEHGEKAGDELNRLEAGQNYGWPRASHGVEYIGDVRIGAGPTAAGLTPPVLVWMTTTAPSGLAVYTGDRFPAWRGDLFSGSLQGKDVRRIRLDTRGRVVGEEAIRIGQRIRDVRQGPDGYLYLLTDGWVNAPILRLEPG